MWPIFYLVMLMIGFFHFGFSTSKKANRGQAKELLELSNGEKYTILLSDGQNFILEKVSGLRGEKSTKIYAHKGKALIANNPVPTSGTYLFEKKMRRDGVWIIDIGVPR